MPFKSEKQRRYMHANLPDIAKRWERDYKQYPRRKSQTINREPTGASEKKRTTILKA